MNKKSSEKQWLEEYNDFIAADTVLIPQGLDVKTQGTVLKLLKPSAKEVFLKILGTHVFVSFLSLSVCHQFGLNPFNTDFSLDAWMMKVGGHSLCMIGCGIFFISLSLFVAGKILTLEEVLVIKKNSLLQHSLLALTSLIFLILFGAEITIGIGALWLLGALVGGAVATETVWQLKKI